MASEGQEIAEVNAQIAQLEHKLHNPPAWIKDAPESVRTAARENIHKDIGNLTVKRDEIIKAAAEREKAESDRMAIKAAAKMEKMSAEEHRELEQLLKKNVINEHDAAKLIGIVNKHELTEEIQKNVEHAYISGTPKARERMDHEAPESTTGKALHNMHLKRENQKYQSIPNAQPDNIEKTFDTAQTVPKKDISHEKVVTRGSFAAHNEVDSEENAKSEDTKDSDLKAKALAATPALQNSKLAQADTNNINPGFAVSNSMNAKSSDIGRA